MSATSDVRLNVQLAPEQKELIEEAAARLGKSTSDFAVSTLVREARHVIHEDSVTHLTDRDRDLFIALLDDTGAEPTEALRAATTQFEQEID
jgi:uncharacterized protein (DUF1778 family)